MGASSYQKRILANNQHLSRDPVFLYLHQAGKAISGRHGAGLCLAYSANGIDWTLNKEEPLFPSWGGDVEVLTYDPIDKKYVLFGRARANKGGSINPIHPHTTFPRIWQGKPEGIWGTLLKDAQNIRTVALHPWLLIPGLFVILTVLAFNFLGDGLRDAADPYR